MLDKREHARQRVFDRARATFVNFAAHPDRVRHIAPTGCARFFKLAQEKSFLRAVRKQHVNGFKVRAGHRENVRRAIDQLGGERLATLIANVYTFGFANLHRVKTWRLAAHGMYPGGRNFNIFAIADQALEKSFRDRTAANIASANEEDAFHGGGRAGERKSKVQSNLLIVDLELQNIVSRDADKGEEIQSARRLPSQLSS